MRGDSLRQDSRNRLDNANLGYGNVSSYGGASDGSSSNRNAVAPGTENLISTVGGLSAVPEGDVLSPSGEGEFCAAPAIADDLQDELDKDKERRKKELKDLEEELEKERKRLQREKELQAKEKARQKAIREARELAEREHELERRRQRMQAERDRIEAEREHWEEQDQRARESEQRARRGPPADPNCRGQDCRAARRYREHVSQGRNRNMGEQRAFERTARDYERDQRAFDRENAAFEDLLDRGYGQEKADHRRRMAKKMRQQLYEEEMRMVQRINQLRARSNDGTLTERGAMEFAELSRQSALLRKQGDRLNVEIERIGNDMASGGIMSFDEAATMSPEQLNERVTVLDQATTDVRDARERLGSTVGQLPDTERHAKAINDHDKARADLEGLYEEARRRRDALPTHHRDRTGEIEAINARLKPLLGNRGITWERQTDLRNELLEQLRNAQLGQQRHEDELRENNRRAVDGMENQIAEAEQTYENARTLAQAAGAQQYASEYNRGLGEFVDSQGKVDVGKVEAKAQEVDALLEDFARHTAAVDDNERRAGTLIPGLDGSPSLAARLGMLPSEISAALDKTGAALKAARTGRDTASAALGERGIRNISLGKAPTCTVTTPFAASYFAGKKQARVDEREAQKALFEAAASGKRGASSTNTPLGGGGNITANSQQAKQAEQVKQAEQYKPPNCSPAGANTPPCQNSGGGLMNEARGGGKKIVGSTPASREDLTRLSGERLAAVQVKREYDSAGSRLSWLTRKLATLDRKIASADEGSEVENTLTNQRSSYAKEAFELQKRYDTLSTRKSELEASLAKQFTKSAMALETPGAVSERREISNLIPKGSPISVNSEQQRSDLKKQLDQIADREQEITRQLKAGPANSRVTEELRNEREDLAKKFDVIDAKLVEEGEKMGGNLAKATIAAAHNETESLSGNSESAERGLEDRLVEIEVTVNQIRKDLEKATPGSIQAWSLEQVLSVFEIEYAAISKVLDAPLGRSAEDAVGAEAIAGTGAGNEAAPPVVVTTAVATTTVVNESDKEEFPDAITAYRDVISNKLVEHLGSVALASERLPDLLTQMASLFGADAVEGLVDGVLAKTPNNDQLAFLDNLYAELLRRGRVAGGEAGARAARELQLQGLNELLDNTDRKSGSNIPVAVRDALEKRLETLFDDLALESGALAEKAMMGKKGDEQLRHLSDVLKLYTLEFAPKRDLRPLLRDLARAEKRLQSAREIKAPEEVIQGTIKTISALQQMLNDKEFMANETQQLALKTGIADSFKLLRKALVAAKGKSEKTEYIDRLIIDSAIKEAQVRDGLGQIDQALIVLQQLGEAKTTEHAAALATALSRAEKAWNKLTVNQRQGLGGLENIQAQKIAALNKWLKLAKEAHHIGIAGNALADIFEEKGDFKSAIEAIETAAGRSPLDPVLSGRLIELKFAAAEGKVDADQAREWLDALSPEARVGAIAAAYQAFGRTGKLDDLTTLFEAAKDIDGVGIDQRKRIDLQFEISRIAAIDLQPDTDEKAKQIAELSKAALAKLAQVTGLKPEQRKQVERIITGVAQRQIDIVRWKKELSSNQVGGFRDIAREALQAGRYDIAGDALVRHLKELEITGDKDEATRRFAETATLMRYYDRLLGDQSLPESQREALTRSLRKASAQFTASINKEISTLQASHQRLEGGRQSIIEGGDASDEALEEAATAVSASLRHLRYLSRLRLMSEVVALSENERSGVISQQSRDLEAKIKRLEETIPDQFVAGVSWRGRPTSDVFEEGPQRIRLQSLLGEVNALYALYDGIRDYYVDHQTGWKGPLVDVNVHGELSRFDPREMYGSARVWARRQIELDLNGFSSFDLGISDQKKARKESARPKRILIQGDINSLFLDDRERGPRLWLELQVQQNRENHHQRRVFELVREDPELSVEQQDEALKQHFAVAEKRYTERGTYKLDMFPEISGIGARQRAEAEVFEMENETLHFSNLKRDLELAREHNDPQKGYMALVLLREAYLAGEIKSYVDYLNTEWHKRSPKYVKRVSLDMKETQTELVAVVADAQLLHQILIRAAHRSVEQLDADDRAYLNERGFIVGGEYRIPKDFKLQATDAGSVFSERSIFDEIVNAGTAAELLATVVLPGGTAAAMSRGVFGRLSAKILLQNAGLWREGMTVTWRVLARAGLSRAGAKMLATWVAEKGVEAALFTGFSRAASTGLNPMQMLNSELWTLNALGKEYFHNLLVIGALKVSGGSVGAIRQAAAGRIGSAVERGIGKYLFKGSADLTAIGIEASVLTSLDSVLSGNTLSSEEFERNFATVLLLRGIHLPQRGLHQLRTGETGGGQGNVSQTARVYENFNTFNRWLVVQRTLRRTMPGLLTAEAARAYAEHPAAKLMRDRFGGSWNAARDAFRARNGKITEAEMQLLFDFRKKVVDELANEIVQEINAKLQAGETRLSIKEKISVEALGSEKLTSDYDLSFEGTLAEIAVYMFNSRWAARWGAASGFQGTESAFGADTNVYTKPIYDMFPGLRRDVLSQDAFAHLAGRKYRTPEQWATYREQVLNRGVSPEVRNRLSELLDNVELKHQEFEKNIADKKGEIEAMTGQRLDLDAAATNRLYEDALIELLRLKNQHQSETSEILKRSLAQQLRDLQAKALYFASEAYLTRAAITHVVENTQRAQRELTVDLLLGRESVELVEAMTAAEGRQSFFEQAANIFKEFNHINDINSGRPEQFNNIAGVVAKYLLRGLDGARIGEVDLNKYADLVEKTVAIEAKRGEPIDLAKVIGETNKADGAREYLKAVEQLLGELTVELSSRQKLPQVEVAEAARKIRQLRAERRAEELPATETLPAEVRVAEGAETVDIGTGTVTVRANVGEVSSGTIDLVDPARALPKLSRAEQAELKRNLARLEPGQVIVNRDGGTLKIGELIGSGQYATVFAEQGSSGWVYRVLRKGFTEADVLLEDFGFLRGQILASQSGGLFRMVKPERRWLVEDVSDPRFIDLEGALVMRVERAKSTAAERIANQPDGITRGQLHAIVATIRHLNRNGVAWTENHFKNFDLEPVDIARDIWRVVIIDPGGFYAAAGNSPYQRYMNARAVQLAFNSPSEGFIREWRAAQDMRVENADVIKELTDRRKKTVSEALISEGELRLDYREVFGTVPETQIGAPLGLIERPAFRRLLGESPEVADALFEAFTGSEVRTRAPVDPNKVVPIREFTPAELNAFRQRLFGELGRSARAEVNELTESVQIDVTDPLVASAESSRPITIEADVSGSETITVLAPGPIGKVAGVRDPFERAPSASLKLPPRTVPRIDASKFEAPYSEPRAGTEWTAPDGSRYTLEDIPGGLDGKYAEAFGVTGGKHVGRVAKIYGKYIDRFPDTWDPASQRMIPQKMTAADIVADIVHGAEVLTKHDILHLKLVEGVSASENPYVIQERLGSQDYTLGRDAVLTAAEQAAVAELFSALRSAKIVWEDGHISNIFFRKSGGKLKAGVLDTDRIVEWGNVPSRRLANLLDSIRAHPSGGPKPIRSLEGTHYWEPTSCDEVSSKLLEYNGWIIFENGRFEFRRIDPDLLDGGFDLTGWRRQNYDPTNIEKVMKLAA